MSVARYSYINAKLRARKAELLTSEQWDALLGARDMFAALRVLDGTGYAQLVKDFDSATEPREVERVLQEDFSQTLSEITTDAPESTQHLMLWINRKFLKEVIKTLLRLRINDADRETVERLLVPLTPFTREELLTLSEASDLETLVSRLRDSFFRNLLASALPRYKEAEEMIVLEQTLDSEVLKNLYNQAQQLKGLDRQVTLKLVGLEIDLINLMITLRVKMLGLPVNKAEQFLLDVEYRLPRSLCLNAVQAGDLEACIQILMESRYKGVLIKGWEAYEQFQTLRVFEQRFYKQIQATSLDAMIGFPFHFGVILGYLNLKWFETLNLKAVMHGKAEKLDPSLIRRALIL